MVIDELIVVLGLDSRQFTEGQRDALDAFRKTQQGAEKFSKDVAAQGQKMSDVFSIVRKGALGIVGAFVGGEAVGFIDKIVNMDAATGRMAKTISTNVENLSTWQNMIRQVGGEATSATSALATLQQEINNVRQGGGMFEGGFGSLMNQAGVSIRDDADSSLRKIRAYIADQVESGKMKPDEAATFLRRVPGMNPDMVNLLLSSTKAFNEYADAAQRAGSATRQSAEDAGYFQQKISVMIQSVEEMGRKLIPVIKLLTKPTGEITAGDLSSTFDSGVRFERGGLMDRFDQWQYKKIWGVTRDEAEMADAKKRLAAGLPAAGAPAAQAAAATPAGRVSRGDRNNNPGNIEFGPFARAHGATGTDGRFAIFPDKASGESAMADLLMKNYAGLTLAQIQRKWVGNEDPNYLGSMSRSTGLGPGDVPNVNDPLVRQKLIAGMARGEGSTLGARGAAAARNAEGGRGGSTSTSTTTIGQIVLPNVKDAEGFAREIEPAMKRSSLLAGANYGLS